MSDDTAEIEPDQHSATQSKGRRRFQKVLRAAHRSIPWLIPDPDFEEFCRLNRKNDAADNEKSCPPCEESVSFHCFWATEYYAPSHVDRLLKGLAQLGWDNDNFGTQ